MIYLQFVHFGGMSVSCLDLPDRLPLENVDYELLKILEERNQNDKEYWSFKGRSTREHTHIYYQYPAMMIPDMQRELLEMIVKLQKNISFVLDPFVGSGTTMTECMFHGLNFVGQDINPLAVLLCRAKMGPFSIPELLRKSKKIFQLISSDQSEDIDIYFPGLIKWFRSDMAIELSKIRRAIINEKTLWARRFFWVALSETTRQCSNSRTSTYKLHIRPGEEIRQRHVNSIKLFEDIVNRNIRELTKQKEKMCNSGLLVKDKYKGRLKVCLKDSCSNVTLPKNTLYDLVITSPPYGDNKSTVPYGQNSFLPLQWIPYSDIDHGMNDSWLNTTSEIDSRSIGGKLVLSQESTSQIKKLSPALSETLKVLDNYKNDRSNRVLAFFVDLNKSLNTISNCVRKNAYLIWTIGNRKVGNYEIPMDRIVVELFKLLDVKFIESVKRNIPQKRMAVRNNIALTMKTEQILIFRKL